MIGVVQILYNSYDRVWLIACRFWITAYCFLKKRERENHTIVFFKKNKVFFLKKNHPIGMRPRPICQWQLRGYAASLGASISKTGQTLPSVYQFAPRIAVASEPRRACLNPSGEVTRRCSGECAVILSLSSSLVVWSWGVSCLLCAES